MYGLVNTPYINAIGGQKSNTLKLVKDLLVGLFKKGVPITLYKFPDTEKPVIFRDDKTALELVRIDYHTNADLAIIMQTKETVNNGTPTKTEYIAHFNRGPGWYYVLSQIGEVRHEGSSTPQRTLYRDKNPRFRNTRDCKAFPALEKLIVKDETLESQRQLYKKSVRG